VGLGLDRRLVVFAQQLVAGADQRLGGEIALGYEIILAAVEDGIEALGLAERSLRQVDVRPGRQREAGGRPALRLTPERRRARARLGAAATARDERNDRDQCQTGEDGKIMTGMVRIGVIALAALALLSACGGRTAANGGDAVPVFVSAPVSTEPWIARSIERGARLAVDDINERGGVRVDGRSRPLRLVVLDHAGSPANALAHARRAVRDKAAVLLTDGTGVTSVAAVTDPAKLPVFICFEGGQDLIEPRRWPTLFRLAPADAVLARRLADYIANLQPKVAMITDDSGYGEQGRKALRESFTIDEVEVVSDQTIQRRARDVAPQVLAARRAGADRLAVWSGAAGIAAVIAAARQAGWDVPIVTGQTGEDPLIRQRLVAHPEWLRDVKFVSSRITSELGPKPFDAFRAHFEDKMGVEKVGVEQNGRPVIQPPDWAMYPYDALHLIEEALTQREALGAPLLDALNVISIVGANGDGRGYSAEYREGVSPADVYIAGFDGFVFEPVSDDALSGTLPPVDQLG
jgi:ABC-type branched-subunit amino acid transport system substrate-binding protein